MRISSSVGKVATLVALAMVAAAGLSGCTGGGSSPVTAGAGSTAPPATTGSPATATPQPTVTAPAPTPVTASYDAARVQWQKGATAISANQGVFWSAAVADLTAGETTDTDPTGYAAAVAALTELIALPDAQQTPAQNAAYHADIDSLNAFFKTPGLYS